MNGNYRDYRDVVLTAPVTVPYVRYSIRSAHWFVAQGLARLVCVANCKLLPFICILSTPYGVR